MSIVRKHHPNLPNTSVSLSVIYSALFNLSKDTFVQEESRFRVLGITWYSVDKQKRSVLGWRLPLYRWDFCQIVYHCQIIPNWIFAWKVAVGGVPSVFENSGKMLATLYSVKSFFALIAFRNSSPNKRFPNVFHILQFWFISYSFFLQLFVFATLRNSCHFFLHNIR